MCVLSHLSRVQLFATLWTVAHQAPRSINTKSNSTIINANGHSFTNYISDGKATCTTDGLKTAKCDNCNVTNSILEKGSHNFRTDWSIDVESTCTTLGSKSHHCKNCDEKKISLLCRKYSTVILYLKFHPYVRIMVITYISALVPTPTPKPFSQKVTTSTVLSVQTAATTKPTLALAIAIKVALLVSSSKSLTSSRSS